MEETAAYTFFAATGVLPSALSCLGCVASVILVSMGIARSPVKAAGTNRFVRGYERSKNRPFILQRRDQPSAPSYSPRTKEGPE